jgi:hypothetical protein
MMMDAFGFDIDIDFITLIKDILLADDRIFHTKN